MKDQISLGPDVVMGNGTPTPSTHSTLQTIPSNELDKSSRTVAHLLVECLEKESVHHVFGVPGEEIEDLLFALAAIEAFGRTLALELAPQRVNVVSPGFIDTGKLLSHLPPTDRAYQLLQSKGADLPTRRVGQPEDAAATYLFAMQNPYLTGQVLSVDGGSSII